MKIDNRFLWGSKLTQHIAKETEDMQMYYEGRLNLYRTILHMMEKDEKALEYIVAHDRYSLSVAGAISDMAEKKFSGKDGGLYERLYMIKGKVRFEYLTTCVADEMVNEELLKEAKQMLEDLKKSKRCGKVVGKVFIGLGIALAIAIVVLLSILAFQGYGHC